MTTNCISSKEVSTGEQTFASGKALFVVNPNNSFAQLSWTSSPDPDELTACASAISDIIKENNISYFLHDVRNVDYTDINLQRTIAKDFCPQVLAAGIARFVHLANFELPELIIMDEITAYIQNKVITNKAVKIEICTTPEGALEWFNHSNLNTSTITATVVKEATVEQVSYEWAVAAQISSSLKQYREKAAMVFRILVKRKSLYSEI